MNSTVLKLIEAISQRCCTPIHVQSLHSIISVSACIWGCCIKDIHTHTRTHLDIWLKVLERFLTRSEVPAFQTLGGGGVDVIDVLPKQVEQSHKTLEKTPTCSFTDRHAGQHDGQSSDGAMMAVIPDQSRRSVTEGSSSANSDSMLAV